MNLETHYATSLVIFFSGEGEKTWILKYGAFDMCTLKFSEVIPGILPQLERSFLW